VSIAFAHLLVLTTFYRKLTPMTNATLREILENLEPSGLKFFMRSSLQNSRGPQDRYTFSQANLSDVTALVPDSAKDSAVDPARKSYRLENSRRAGRARPKTGRLLTDNGSQKFLGNRRNYSASSSAGRGVRSGTLAIAMSRRNHGHTLPFGSKGSNLAAKRVRKRSNELKTHFSFTPACRSR